MFPRVLLLAAACVFAALPVTGHAVTLQVNCDQPSSKFPTINSALKVLSGLLGSLTPNTINVTGACNENVDIEGMNVTLTAQNGASITDASGGTKPVVAMRRSALVNLNGFAIRGGGGLYGAAVLCIDNSTCYLSSNNVQNNAQLPNATAVAAYQGSSVNLANDVLERTALGLVVFNGSRAVLGGAILRNNNVGASIGFGSTYTGIGVTVENNTGMGLQIGNHAYATIANHTISGNGTGVWLNIQSEALFILNDSISGNATGVSIGHSSFANFAVASVIGNASQPDIQCSGSFSGAQGAANVGTTNCP
jgi:hypothetical protein